MRPRGMRRGGSRRISRNCRTSYIDETGVAVPAFRKWRVGNRADAGLASGPGLLDAPNYSRSSGATLTRLSPPTFLYTASRMVPSKCHARFGGGTPQSDADLHRNFWNKNAKCCARLKRLLAVAQNPADRQRVSILVRCAIAPSN
jgi:hypothetical protein